MNAPVQADVFVLAPTAVFDPAKPVYVGKDDPALLAGMDEFAAVAVRPVFDGLPVAVHMPAYRQANGAHFGVAEPSKLFWNDGPTPVSSDVFAEFAAFLTGRDPSLPYVLFSHSQGSILAALLMTVFLPELATAAQRDAMAACYLVGWGLNDEILARSPYPASTSPTDTGTIISWNTATASEVRGTVRSTWGDASTRAVNPVTFDETTEHVPATRNGFSLLRATGEAEAQRHEHLTGARVLRPSDEGGPFGGQVVLVDIDEHSFRSAEEIAEQDAATLGYTHHWDISLFAGAIRENVVQRLRLGLVAG